ncbi:MAG: hypothetical protein Q9175_004651 [Cornicularia normoerica]
MGPGWSQPKTIQHWPGKLLNEISNKVPTRIQYDENTGQVKKWGFQCNYDEDGTDVKEFFKLHLDPKYEDPRPNAPKVEDARRWLRDYLHCIHSHVRETLSDSFPRWTVERTEFVFSVPTTWNNPHMIADMEGIVKDAGFGFDGPEHRTTIDFHEIIFARLQKIQEYLLENPEDVAEIMVRDKFERVKCSFGTPVISTRSRISLEVPGLAAGHHHPEISIEDSRMIFTHEEFKVVFDSQVDLMIRLIDQQFMRVQENHPGANISHLVLSGGLGSSPYVKQRFKAHYESGGYSSSRIGSQNTKIVIVAEP